MGRTADRLPVVSSNGPDIKWEPTENQVKSLERVLGTKAFPKIARETLVRICTNYLIWRRAELGAGKKSEVFEVWTGKTGVRKTLERMIALGDGAYPRLDSEAAKLVENALFDGLQQAGVALTKSDLKPPSLDPDYTNDAYEPAGSNLYFTRGLMLRFAAVFRVAVKHVDDELTHLGEGIKPGQAFSEWLGEMSSWAEDYGYPHAPAAGGGASKFAELLFELHKMLPSDLREKRMASASAMNQRLRRHQDQILSKKKK